MTLAALIVGVAVLALAAFVGLRGLLSRRGPLESRLRWLVWPFLALCGFITELAYLGLIPRAFRLWPGFDKLAHFVLLGGLVFFLDLWLRRRDLSLGRLRLPLALVLVLGVAVVDELLQALSPVRSFELLDLLCDLGGMVLALWFTRRVLRPPTSAPR